MSRMSPRVSPVCRSNPAAFSSPAAIELARGQRINAVSPTLLTESVAAYGGLFPGVVTVPAARVALAYVRSVEGPLTGRVFRVWQ